MPCKVCNGHESDLANIQTKITLLMADQDAAVTITEKDKIRPQIKALERTRTEIQTELAQHKKLSPH
jgi:hypothetical protein